MAENEVPKIEEERVGEEEYNRAVKLLVDLKVYNRPCELCASTAWSLQPYVVTTAGLQKTGSYFFGGVTFPSMPLICSTCGNTKLLNVYALKLRTRPSQLSEDANG